MALITSELKKIYEEDVSANGSVSEAFFLKLAASLNGVIDNAIWQVGDIRQSALTESQFASANGYSNSLPESQKKWVLMKGQSISGSAFHSRYGIATLPNAIRTSGNGAFLGQINDEAPLTFQTSKNAAHSHTIQQRGYSYGNGGQRSSYSLSSGFTDEGAPSGWETTLPSINSQMTTSGDEARPNTVRVNFFLKIND